MTDAAMDRLVGRLRETADHQDYSLGIIISTDLLREAADAITVLRADMSAADSEIAMGRQRLAVSEEAMRRIIAELDAARTARDRQQMGGGFEATGHFAVIDPNWGEPMVVCETVRETAEEAIEAAIWLQSLSLYSGAQLHCVPQVGGKWESLEHYKFKVAPVFVAILPPATDPLREAAGVPEVAALVDALAALILNIDAGGATLGAMADARTALAPFTAISDGEG